MLKLQNGDSVKKMRIYHQYQGTRGGLVIERRTTELEVGGFDPHSGRHVSLSKIHLPPKKYR